MPSSTVMGFESSCDCADLSPSRFEVTAIAPAVEVDRTLIRKPFRINKNYWEIFSFLDYVIVKIHFAGLSSNQFLRSASHIM